MDVYDFGQLDSWQELAAGEAISFEVGSSGRRVEFELIPLGDPVELRVRDDDGERLMAVVQSASRFRFVPNSVETGCDVFLSGAALLRTRETVQRVDNPEQVSFTTIERRREMSPEMAQLRELMMVNNLRVEQRLAADRRERDEFDRRHKRGKYQEQEKQDVVDVDDADFGGEDDESGVRSAPRRKGGKPDTGRASPSGDEAAQSGADAAE